MEEKNQQKQATTIVERIMAKLKLGDSGKLQSFFDRQVKKLNKDIESFKQSIKNAQYNSERKLDNLREQLEDAEDNLAELYDAVVPEDVENNAKQDAFAITYWSKIEDAEELVESIKEKIEQERIDTEETINSYNDQIKELEYRISKIS